MAQIIFCSRSLANPKILTLDEATSSLDYKNINNVMEILSKLFKSKMTVIMISHQTELVKYCDKVIVFKDGSVHDKTELTIRKTF
jgi:putative ABC transport system ATP-binding protein